MVKKPIFILGTHRSGTTFLANILSKHPALAYWPEPKYVWEIGNLNHDNDELNENHVNPKVKTQITEEFRKYLSSHDGKRLLEKTPSNCLRIKFIDTIFPDAHFVHIVRDGRSVVKSTEQLVAKKIPLKIVLRRARQIPLLEWPKYTKALLQKMLPFEATKADSLWGPKPKGWRNWIKNDSKNVILAKQWAATVTRAIEDGKAIDPQRFHRISYDELVLNPRQTMKNVLDAVELEPCDDLLEFAGQNAKPDRLNTWSEQLTNNALQEIRPIMEDVNKSLGYKW